MTMVQQNTKMLNVNNSRQFASMSKQLKQLQNLVKSSSSRSSSSTSSSNDLSSSMSSSTTDTVVGETRKQTSRSSSPVPKKKVKFENDGGYKKSKTYRSYCPEMQQIVDQFNEETSANMLWDFRPGKVCRSCVIAALAGQPCGMRNHYLKMFPEMDHDEVITETGLTSVDEAIERFNDGEFRIKK